MVSGIFLKVIHTLRNLGTMARIGQGLPKVLNRLVRGSECRYESAVGLALGGQHSCIKNGIGKNFLKLSRSSVYNMGKFAQIFR